MIVDVDRDSQEVGWGKEKGRRASRRTGLRTGITISYGLNLCYR